MVWFQPELQVTYRPRASVRALGPQYLDYGRWRRVVARQHAGTINPRYLAPPGAVLAMAAGVLIGLAAAGLAAGSGLDLARAGDGRVAVPAIYLAGVLAVTASALRLLRLPAAVRAAAGPDHDAHLLGSRLPDQPPQPDARPRPRAVAPVSGRGRQPRRGRRAHAGWPGSPARSRVSASSRSPGYVILMLRSLPGTMRTAISGR